jgi:hypothetical protein
MLFSLTDISPGEQITASYTKEGYHDPSKPCLCSTCRPRDPPSAPERRQPLPADLVLKSGKKKRRGGKRARVRRENRKSRMDEHGIPSGSGNDLEYTSTGDSTC